MNMISYHDATGFGERSTSTRHILEQASTFRLPFAVTLSTHRQLPAIASLKGSFSLYILSRKKEHPDEPVMVAKPEEGISEQLLE